jgi:hypothetical protein
MYASLAASVGLGVGDSLGCLGFSDSLVGLLGKIRHERGLVLGLGGGMAGLFVLLRFFLSVGLGGLQPLLSGFVLLLGLRVIRVPHHLLGPVRAVLQAMALRQPEPVEAALGVTVSGLVEIITAMLRTVAALEKHLAETFVQHPLAPVLTSVPGLGPILAARVLAEIGDDPDRFSSANGLRAFAGTAPVTRTSGRSRSVKARKVRNKRLNDACHWWAFPR